MLQSLAILMVSLFVMGVSAGPEFSVLEAGLSREIKKCPEGCESPIEQAAFASFVIEQTSDGKVSIGAKISKNYQCYIEENCLFKNTKSVKVLVPSYSALKKAIGKLVVSETFLDDEIIEGTVCGVMLPQGSVDGADIILQCNLGRQDTSYVMYFYLKATL